MIRYKKYLTEGSINTIAVTFLYTSSLNTISRNPSVFFKNALSADRKFKSPSRWKLILPLSRLEYCTVAMRKKHHFLMVSIANWPMFRRLKITNQIVIFVKHNNKHN
jgi:hypothetical protein